MNFHLFFLYFKDKKEKANKILSLNNSKNQDKIYIQEFLCVEKIN